MATTNSRTRKSAAPRKGPAAPGEETSEEVAPDEGTPLSATPKLPKKSAKKSAKKAAKK